MQDQVRKLSYHLIRTYSKTGELLQSLFESPGKTDFLTSFDLTMADVNKCVALYRQWHHYDAAEAWYYDQHGKAPRTPDDALALLRTWKGRMH